MRIFLALFFALLPAPVVAAAGESYLYRAELIQAAPGKLLELMDLCQTRAATLEAAGEPAPLWMRHSQGDHWDLLLLFPMGSYTDYCGAARVAMRGKADHSVPGLAEKITADIAWREDLFVFGPSLDAVKQVFAQAKFFHIEMFRALPGQQSDLYKERLMENVYQKSMHRPENLIFVRDQGAAWGLFTIGGYRDLSHYAESARIPPEEEEAAARAASFSSSSEIGPYLRRFISEHHDTLASGVARVPKK